MFIESSRSETAVALLHIWWYYSKWFTSHVKNERDPKHYCDNLDIYQQICRLRDRTVGRYLSSFAKPNSKNQKVNGQFESLLFTFEPLECDNKEDLCYWNLEFIDRNQSIIVLVFFFAAGRQGREKNETATLLSGQNLVLDMALHTDISTAISSVSKCTFNHSSCHSNRKNRKKTREIWRRIAWSFLNNQPVKIFYSQ